MAANNSLIDVTPQQLGDASSKISQKNEEFKKEYDELMKEIEGFEAKWSGEDFDVFKQKMIEYKPVMDSMHQLMDDYAKYLNDSKTAYENTQTQMKQAAEGITKK